MGRCKNIIPEFKRQLTKIMEEENNPILSSRSLRISIALAYIVYCIIFIVLYVVSCGIPPETFVSFRRSLLRSGVS